MAVADQVLGGESLSVACQTYLQMDSAGSGWRRCFSGKLAGMHAVAGFAEAAGDLTWLNAEA